MTFVGNDEKYKPPIGLYGNTKDGKLSLIGILTLNLECQKVVYKPVVEPEPEPPETLSDKHKGLTISTPFILFIGVVVYAIVLLGARHFEIKTQSQH